MPGTQHLDPGYASYLRDPDPGRWPSQNQLKEKNMNNHTNERRVFIVIASISILLVMVCAAFAGTKSRVQKIRFEYNIMQQKHIADG